MRQIAEDIWVHEDSMNMLGTQLGLRMTVVRLEGGSLWLHSATALTPELQQQVNALGSVRYIVAANNHHSRWLQDWADAYPEADLYVSAGIPRKVPLSKYHILQPGIEAPWRNDLSWETMPSVPLFCETVFFHHKSQSLIVTDFIQNYPDEQPADSFSGVMTKYVFQPIGFKGCCIAPPLKLGLTIKDKQAFGRFVEHVKSWDFQRIVVTHGEVIEQQAKSVFEKLTHRFCS